MTAPPFFIVGFQRSGTTLLRVMLNAHPDIAIPLDTVGLWKRYEGALASFGDLRDPTNRRRLVSQLLEDPRIRLWETPLDPDDIVQRAAEGTYAGVIRSFHEAYAAAHGKVRWGDKDPGNMVRMDDLNRWFPDCLFLHIIRDGRDACLSHLEQDFGFDNLLACASSWREEVEWVRRIGRILGSRYHEVLYEDLVRSPEKTLQLICDFLGVPFSPVMLSYHTHVGDAVPDEKKHLWPLLSRPPQATNAGRWKSRLSEPQRICFEKRAGTVLADLGYEVLPGKPRGAYLEEVRHFASSAWRALRRRLAPRPQP